ncbi:hypothetical protein BS50DRAFT_568552 [Corynespora cassiicola Philippines]|uniref:Uncharacterized protein n=1 Tax=Corynespora cassiicola Philippines TaxID=1448308 RepID=A0A2T2P5J5_CORCC|nr:hypothetical protein BS50DRAFT_568552 [Corynespora cassiicola Philippines]
MDDCWEIRERLQREPCLKWGFVIYQCTYGDDDAWDRFMHYLNTHFRLTLEEENNDTDHGLFSRIDWNVQEDSSLDNATSEEVRDRFSKWVEENQGQNFFPGTARFQACVRVNKHALYSVLNKAPPPEKWDTWGKGYVGLVLLNESDEECSVGIAYLVPRIFVLMDCGWDTFTMPAGKVATP